MNIFEFGSWTPAQKDQWLNELRGAGFTGNTQTLANANPYSAPMSVSDYANSLLSTGPRSYLYPNPSDLGGPRSAFDNESDWMNLYNAVISGTVKPTDEQDFMGLLAPNSDLKAYDTNEFSKLSPEMQAWAKQNPSAFLQDAMAHRNEANNDLGSIGAEGGYANPENIRIDANGRPDYSQAGYMQIDDTDEFGDLIKLAVISGLTYGFGQLGAGLFAVDGAAAGASAAEGLTGGAALDAGATAGANAANSMVPQLARGAARGLANSALTGSDPITGMVAGTVTSGTGSYLNANPIFGDDPSNLANRMANGAILGTEGAVIRGGDIETGALSGATTGLLNTVSPDTSMVNSMVAGTITNNLVGVSDQQVSSGTTNRTSNTGNTGSTNNTNDTERTNNTGSTSNAGYRQQIANLIGGNAQNTPRSYRNDIAALMG